VLLVGGGGAAALLREEEVMSLQHAAKQQQLQVIEQQEQLLELRAENRQLRIQEAEDRKRIQQLLSLTKPVQQEVTFMRDVRPTKLTTTPVGPPTRVIQQEGDGQSVEVVCPGAMGAPTVKKGRAPLGAVQHQHVTTGAGTGARVAAGAGGAEPTVATRVLRTVYLPSEKTDSMLLTIDALQRELDEYKRVGEEKVSLLMEQRDTAMAEGKVQVERLLTRVAEVEERASTLSTLLRNNEKEYLLLRHNTAVAERVMKEDNIGLQEQNKTLVARHQQEKTILQEEHQQFAEELGRQTETYVHTFRSHATAREKERDEAHAQMVHHKTQHEETKGALEQRIGQMAQKIGRLDKVRKLTSQQKKWEAAQNTKEAQRKQRQVDLRPGKGGTASRATLLYDRYVEGARAEVLAEGMSEDDAGVEEIIVRRAVGAASHGGIAGGEPATKRPS
jgi:hypothetical protein